MKICQSIKIVLLTGAVSAQLLVSGCVVDQHEQQIVMQRQREDNLLIQDELRRMRGRVEAMEIELERVSQQLNTLSTDQSRGLQSQMQGFNATLDDLQKRIRAVDTARENDKKEIVDSLSKRIQSVLSTPSARSSTSGGSSAPKRAVSNEGYEHTVQSGETLSAIAKAYGTSAADIIQANNLKSADVLRVGQKLFIPAP